MKKKLFTAVLALTMLLGLIPGTAFAADSTHSHPICGASCSGHTEKHGDVPWEPLTQAIVDAPENSGTIHNKNYYLVEDITVKNDIFIHEVYNGNPVNLCLNGYSFTFQRMSEGDSAHYFKAQNSKNYTLNICDCKGTGRIEQAGGNMYCINVVRGSTLNFYSGTMKSNGSGVISISDASAVTVYGGTVENSNTRSGYAIGNSSNGSLTILGGGTITGGQYSVSNFSNGTLTISGTPTISGGTADIQLKTSADATLSTAKVDVTGYTGDPLTVYEAPTTASPLENRVGACAIKCGADGKFKLTNTCYKYVFDNGGMVIKTDHQWADTWSSDNAGTHHWHNCENDGCPITDNSKKPGYEAHSGGTATCAARAVCDTCHLAYGSTEPHQTPLTHTPKVEPTCTDYGVKEYWTCSVCNKSFSDKDGMFSIRNLENWKTSTGQIPMAAHDFSGNYLSDENGHWHKCQNCTATDAKVNHTGGTATCKDKAVCTVCGQSYGELADHSWGEDYEKDDTQHWQKCSVCQIETVKEDHVYDNNTDTTCNTCGYERPALSDVVTISVTGETVKIGEPLTANVSGAPADVTLKYAWKVSGEDTILSMDLTYTPTTADVVGKTLTLTVSTEDPRYSGTVTFTTGTVTKGDQAAPSRDLFSVTDADQGQNNGAITVNGEVANLEYCLKPADGSEPTYVPATARIENLPAGTYEFRYKGTGTHDASPTTELEVRTLTPDAKELAIGGSIAHGSVSAVRSEVNPGDIVKLTVTPAAGYELASLDANYGNGQSETPTWNESAGAYTFTMPDAAVTVTATFTAITYTIDYQYEGVANGSFTVENGSITLAAAAREGYTLEGWAFTDGGEKLATATAAALMERAENKTVKLYPVWTQNEPDPGHTHQYGDTWTFDAANHWHQCTAAGCPDLTGSKKDSAAHTEDGGTVNKPATNTETGVKTYQCSVCGCVLRTEEIPVLTYSISGAVTEKDESQNDKPVEGVEVKLMQGNKQIGESVTTNAQGTYSFAGVPAGTYNVVAVKGDVTKTILVVLTSTNAENRDIKIPSENISSVLKIEESSTSTEPSAAEVEKTVVGGLEEEAEEQKEQGQPAASITVTMTVKKEEENTEEQAVKSAIDAIKAEAAGSSQQSPKKIEFLSINVEKTVTVAASETTEPITQTKKLLEIVIPYNFTGKSNVTVYRHHDNSAEVLKIAEGDTQKDGTFRLDETNGLIYIYASKFSTYAIGYTEINSGDTPVTPPDEEDKPDPSTPSSGGGSSSPATYSPIIEKSIHGEVEVKPGNPAQGDRVTVTLTPDKGYQIDSITVTDRNGRPVTVTDNGDGTYTFIQPNGKVTISASFKADGGYGSCPKDHTCLIARFPDISPTAWYHDGVHYCLEHGLMGGYDTGLFGPDDYLSRAQLVQMLYNQAGRPDVTEESSFEDVAPDAWYAKAVAWAQQSGIVSGYDSRHFYPDGRITREQLAVILWRHAGSPAATGPALDFTDADNVSGYAADALRWAVDQEIIYGKGSGILDPTGLATRAEAASMLMRYGTINIL